MNFIEQIKGHSENIGTGISNIKIKDLEARLNLKLPNDFKEYLLTYNYAELYGDPIYGIYHKDESLELDIYTNNKDKEHFKYGFLEIFSNDIDGAVYLRPDTGAIYSFFNIPMANSFSEFIELLLNEN